MATSSSSPSLRRRASLEHHGAHGHATESPRGRPPPPKELKHGGLRRTFSDAGLSGSKVLGQRVSIFWEGTDEGDMWYPGTVVEFDHAKKEYLVEYDDGDRDWYDLTKIKYSVLPPKGKEKGKEEAARAAAAGDAATFDTSDQPRTQSTKNRITFASLGMQGVMLLGQRAEIFWANPNAEDMWYAGTILEYRVSDSCHFVKFDDGDSDWYNLDEIKYRIPADEVAKIRLKESGERSGAAVKNDDAPDPIASSSSSSSSSSSPTSSSSSLAHHEVHSHHTAHGHTGMYTASPGGDKSKPNDTLQARHLLGAKSVGCVVDIFWEDDDDGSGSGSQWYRGTLDEYDPSGGNASAYHITYEDGDEAWYDMTKIKHRVVRTASKPKPVIAAAQPAASAARSKAWREDLKRRRAARKDGDLGYEVDGELSVGGVVALRIVHEAMLRERYFNKTEQERLNEYWDFQMRAFAGFGGKKNKKKKKKNMSKGELSAHNKERMRISQQLRDSLHASNAAGAVGARNVVMPPLVLEKRLTTRGSDLQDRFHELARAHGDLDAPHLPGQVPDAADSGREDSAAGEKHGSQIKRMKDEAHGHALDSGSKVPDRIEHVEDPNGEATEKELLSGAQVPPPPAPAVKASLDKLLAAMKTGELGDGEKEPEEYIKEFLNDVPEKEIVVGSISLRDVQLQERKIEMERLDTMRREVARYRRREEALLVQEERARLRVLSEADARAAKLDARHHRNIQALRRMERALRRSFVRKEDQLRRNLEDQHAIVNKRLGKLEKRQGVDELSWSVFKVRWDRVPQPMAIDVKLMRAVRDRLPNGKYSVLVTLYDRIGGSPLHWTEAGLNGHQIGLPGATEPVRHKGRYYDLDTHVAKTCYTVCPSRRDVKPTLTYVIELFQLGMGKWPDRVVAWSVLPAVDVASDYTTGKFRVPLLRGPVDANLDLYSKFEEAYTLDLDRWLCNLYLEIRLESKEVITGDGTTRLRNQEIEMDFAKQLLKVKRQQANDYGFAGPPQTDPHAPSAAANGKGEGYVDDIMRDAHALDDESGYHDVDSEGNTSASKAAAARIHDPAPVAFGGYQAPTADISKRKLGRRTTSGVALGRRAAFNAVAATDRVISDDLSKLGMSDFKKGEALAMKTDIQSLAKYSTAVMRRGSPSFTETSEAARRLVFLWYEMVDEYRIRRWATLEFWVSFMILVLGFYVRLYLHYLGLYLYLKLIGVSHVQFGNPVQAYQVLTKYAQNMAIHYELGAAVSGQVFNIMVFIASMIIVWAWRKIMGRLPDVLSKWMMGFGVGVVLDAMLVFIVDLAVGNFNCEKDYLCGSSYMDTSCRCMTGDAFKLPERFAKIEGSSAVGWILISFANFILLFVAGTLFYNYLLLQHFNGRVWDLYWRLSALEQDMFVPEDLELSTSELRWVCSKAARWRGPRGDKRKVKVKQYIYSDPLDPTFKETTTHLAIYHEDSKGVRTLYRHFLRSPDGTLLEVFGDLVEDFQGEYISLEKALLGAADQVMASKKRV